MSTNIERAIAKARDSMRLDYDTHKLVWDVVERAYQFTNGNTDDMISVAEARMIEALDALARAVLGTDP